MTKIDHLRIEIKRVSNGFVVELSMYDATNYDRKTTETIHQTLEAAFDYIGTQTEIAEEGFKLALTA